MRAGESPAFLQASIYLAEVPKTVDALVLRQIEQHRLRRERRAVEQHQRRARADAGGEPVPHHPAAGGEIEQPLAGAQVALQPVFLHMLQQRAAGAVHDAFRHAGGARRKQNIERMIERQPREGQLFRRMGFEEIFQRPRARNLRGGFCRIAEIGHDHHGRRGGELLGDGCDLVGNRQRLAVVPIAVDRHEDLGLDLAKAVEHPALAEIGRAGREDGAERSDRQHQRDGLRQIRHHRRDAVALADAGRAQRLLQPRDQRLQLVPGQPVGDLVLAAEDQRVARAGRLQQVLGEIDLGVGEKLRARHLVAVDQAARALVADDAAIIPDQVPEFGAVGDRPGVQLAVIFELEPVPLVGFGDEGHHLGLGHPLRARAPQRPFRRRNC